MDHAEAQPQSVADIIAVPQAELVLGQLPQAHIVISAQCAILPGIACAHLPIGQHATSHGKFEALGARLSDIDACQRVSRIGCGRVGAIKLEQGSGDVQVWPDIPFCTQFVIGELFRREIFLRGGE